MYGKEPFQMKLIKVILIGLAMIMFAGTAQASIFATELVDYSASLDGSGFYNDPNDLVGAPATYCAGWPATATDHISIVEPSWGDGYITTLNEGDYAVVKFDHQVTNDPNNPYGLDFIVYGNAFFVGNGYVADDTDHTSYTLTGGAFTESVLVSVSQYGTEWYTYELGPYGDNLFPTNPWVWDPDLYDSTGNGWTDVQNDYTLPVDPSLTASDFAGLSSYEGMLLYEGSAGGTGFDLAESDYDWIQYIKVEGISGLAGGEIDAFADVAPVPIPGAVWLLGSGLIGVIGMRRKTL
jgi:hypothetical protein